ncbi:MAG: T9SS type A sorting domain-containing protein [Flavobacteriales bacterium]|nr:T9SS type A sorting domain-containing protein [Flavobacteriales bacterium]
MLRTLLPLMMCCALRAHATTWTIGPGQTYTLPSQVSTLVGDGDTVNIEAGVYPSDVARWQADNLVLRGVGGFAHLESNGLSWGGKAIWVIQGDNTTVEWIEFSECQVPDHNGAGIRLEGLKLTVRHCWFHHNENGILCGEYHPSTVRIEYSEFGHHGYGDGYSHNLYIGHVDSLIFRYNYSHHADVGHELKSRAWVNVIEYNRFSNESDGTASREIDLPNGGQAYLIGNVIQQGLQSQNSNMVGFGMEGTSNPGPHELYAVENTLVNEKANGSFFQAPANVFFKSYGNILAGGGSYMSAWPTSIDTLGNLRTTSIASVGFADAVNYDYHITASSPAHAIAYPAGVASSGYPLVAWYEYVHPVNGTLRCQHATLDAGAFETCTTTGMGWGSAPECQVFPNPASEVLHVRAMAGEPRLRFDVLDAAGQLVLRANATGSQLTSIPLQGLSAGSYVLRIRGERWQRSFPFVTVP